MAFGKVHKRLTEVTAMKRRDKLATLMKPCKPKGEKGYVKRWTNGKKSLRRWRR